MQDVARVARVSAPTVSAVINGKGRVRPELKQRVLRAIEALDYHPNQLARSLRVRRTEILAVIMPQIASPFFTEILRGAEDTARKKGYSIVIGDSGADPQEESRQIRALVTRQVDGILLAPADSIRDLPFLQKHIPVVLFDRIPAGYSGPAVVTNNTEAASEATQHLIQLGHKRIGIITGEQGVSTAAERTEGFRKAMGDAGLPVRSEYVVCGNYRLEEGYSCVRKLMKLPAPPTAIFSCNYEMTLGLMRALAELRIACPGQISVLGFDDFVVGLDGFSWATLFSPQLTAVAQPSYEIGKAATQLLLSRIDASNKTEKPDGLAGSGIVRLKCELKIRESTAPPPQDS
jgi:DNA-binding LacI/PurR family transcriptional regulator